jgi:membrane-bound metal-dependent hydrolase YbcI (DUF457 family)
LGRRIGLRINRTGVMIGSLLPDIDFLILVPWLGRARGHRTVTHSPAWHIITGVVFRRWGIGSFLLGAVLHSIVDDLSLGRPPGVAWLWPFQSSRLHLLCR